MESFKWLMGQKRTCETPPKMRGQTEREIKFKKDIYEELQKLQEKMGRDIPIYLEGEPSNPYEVATAMVMEKGAYMADFVDDEKGHIAQLRYDRIYE